MDTEQWESFQPQPLKNKSDEHRKKIMFSYRKPRDPSQRVSPEFTIDRHVFKRQYYYISSYTAQSFNENLIKKYKAEIKVYKLAKIFFNVSYNIIFLT